MLKMDYFRFTLREAHFLVSSPNRRYRGAETTNEIMLRSVRIGPVVNYVKYFIVRWSHEEN